MRLRHLVPMALLALTGHLACGPDPKENPEVSASAARLTAPNSLLQNSLSSNGLFQNGLFQNGLFQNGLFQNGLMQNGLLQGVLWQDGLWQQNPAALELLRANEYTRALLKYTYECAMGPTQSTVLDPGPTPEHANLELHGLLGLAPQWGQPGGACDKSCQRWVTACVLARTNAYGAKVDISMRAPDDAPAHVKAALAVTAEERAAYPLREGAFYGNLFRQEGPPNGTAVMVPRFYACAGPGSNIPEVTKRFCSSQGAGGPIAVVGACEPRPEFPRAACLGVSGDGATGALHDCYERTDPADRGERYREVVTVYLKVPPAVCGNSVCEAGEEGEAGEAVCPSDCHSGGWSRSFATVLASPISSGTSAPVKYRWVRTSAVGPDDTVVLAGVAPSTVDVGGGPLDTGPDGTLYGVLAKYGPDGHHLWSKRFGFGFGPQLFQLTPTAVAVARDGSIGVVLDEFRASLIINHSRYLTKVAKFTQDGQLLWMKKTFESPATVLGGGRADALTFGNNGDLVIASRCYGSITFDSIELGGSSGIRTEVVAKVSPDGALRWGAIHPADDIEGAQTIAADHDGNVLLSLRRGVDGGALWKLDSASGATVWENPGVHGGVAVGPNGNVYATGALSIGQSQPPYAFHLPPTVQANDFFVVEYAAADGAPLHVRVVTPTCDDGTTSCRNGQPTPPAFEGRDIAFDAAGNVIVGLLGGGVGATIDFGAGPFRTHKTDDVFVAAFTPTLEPLWSKHVPMVLGGVARGMQLDSRGRVIMSGTFAGSMLVDDRLLVSTIPEQEGVANTFLAAFAAPSPADVTAPTLSDGGVGGEGVQAGQADQVDHLPKPMTLQATSPEGAEVFFVPPTAADEGHAGVSVTCSPPSNSLFPLGTTTVTCTAADPLGNATSATFDVTVVDHLGPAFPQAPAPIVVDAAGPAGAYVAFDQPTAIDLVDSAPQVTCAPASGSLFSIGMTTVVCSAADVSENVTKISFAVIVRGPGGDATPPLISAPNAVEATAVDSDGTFVSYAISALDAVDGPVAVSCAPPPSAEFPPGTTTVTCSAMDSRGNAATRSFPVKVTYDFAGVQQPINADGSSSFKLGSTVPVRFKLKGNSALVDDAHATLTAVKLSAAPTGTDQKAGSTDEPDEGGVFHYQWENEDRYVYKLGTQGLSKGTWQLRIDLGDGVKHSAQISLRK